MEHSNNAFETRDEAKKARNQRRANGEYWNDVFRSSLDVLKRFYVGTYYGFVNWEHSLKKGK
ncbi:MAG: hypothetical protein BBJ57_07325 [Desulfobacterales bacterium PC51MH44]|nr:MAG: hypothetical protein BBJ57_07325 [Desulfobacterales bacterium PC51MH44]